MKNSRFQISYLVHAATRLSHRIFLASVTALLLCMPLPKGALASAGGLDLTFGNQGKVETDFFGNVDVVSGLALQPDGKIIAAGGAAFPNNVGNFALARYNSNGGLDATFGSGGKVTTAFATSISSIQGVVIQPDGKIVAVGAADNNLALARYNSNGSLDPAFGTGGQVTTTISDAGVFNDVALQPDGKIVAAGTVTTFQDSHERFLIARYNSDGSLDNTFGSGGTAITDFPGDSDRGNGLVITADGKMVVGGATFTTGGISDFALVRYNSDGSPDLTFGSGGMVTTDFGAFDSCLCITLQPDGKLVAAGDAISSSFVDGLGIARYNIDGSLDATFGVGGKSNQFVQVSARGVAVLSNGKIIVGGLELNPSTGQTFDFAAVRYNSNGLLDNTFGTGGVSHAGINSNVAQVNTIALQTDGKLLVGGSIINPQTSFDFAVARFNGDVSSSSFDICIQDDSSGNIFQFNSTTGAYQFTRCNGGLVLGGAGTITRRGGIITLQHNSTDRRVSATVDTNANRGSASIQVFSLGTSFTITDRNTLNNTCACP
jgi:uncharacterized delta-60 repeat protein